MAVRVAASFIVEPNLSYGDEGLYTGSARALLAPRGQEIPLVLPSGDKVTLVGKTIRYNLAPGYPLLLAGLAAVGVDAISELRIAQSLLGAVSGVLIWLLATRLFGRTPGLLAAIVFAMYPPTVYLCTVLYPQCVLSLVMYVGLWLCLMARARESHALAAACGLAFGVAALCVPPAVALALAAIIWLGLARKTAHWRRVGLIAALVGGALIGLAPSRVPGLGGNLTSPVYALIRGMHRSNRPGLTAWTVAHGEPRDGSAQRQPPTDAAGEGSARSGDGGIISFVSRDPWGFVKFTADRLWTFYRPYVVTATKTRYTSGKYRLLAIVSTGPVLLFGVMGGVLAWKRNPGSRLLTLSIMLYTATYTLLLTNQRYRLPLDPLFIVLGAYAICQLGERYLRRRPRQDADGSAMRFSLTDPANGGLFSLLRRQHQRVSTSIAGTDAFHTVSASRYALWTALRAGGKGHVVGRVLDAGGGRTPYRGAFEEGIQSYTAIDIVPADGKTDCVADIAELPLRQEAFDSVLCSQVLEHVPDPPRALQEFARVLAPGGCLLLSVPHLSRLHEEPHDYYRYTEYGVRYLLDRAGFRRLTIASAGGLVSFLQSQVATVILAVLWPIAVLRPFCLLVSAFVAKACVWLDGKIGTDRLFPLNYVVIAHKDGGTTRADDRGRHACRDAAGLRSTDDTATETVSAGRGAYLAVTK